MRKIATNSMAIVAAALVPAAAIVAYYTFSTYAVPGSGEDAYAWVRIKNFLVMALAISVGHVVALGIPAFLVLSWTRAITWWSSLLVGFVLGCIPVGFWSWPLSYPELKSSASHWDGEKMVQTMVDGVPTTAGWVSYINGVAFMGAFGALGGLAFWLVWRGLRPNRVAGGF